MMDDKFHLEEKELNEFNKKVVNELIEEGLLEKKEGEYLYTEKGMIELQKHGYMLSKWFISMGKVK